MELKEPKRRQKMEIRSVWEVTDEDMSIYQAATDKYICNSLQEAIPLGKQLEDSGESVVVEIDERIYRCIVTTVVGTRKNVCTVC